MLGTKFSVPDLKSDMALFYDSTPPFSGWYFCSYYNDLIDSLVDQDLVFVDCSKKHSHVFRNNRLRDPFSSSRNGHFVYYGPLSIDWSIDNEKK